MRGGADAGEGEGDIPAWDPRLLSRRGFEGRVGRGLRTGLVLSLVPDDEGRTR